MVEEIQLSVLGKVLERDKSELSGETRTRLLLPVRYGGAGLTASEVILECARAAGFKAAEPFLVELFGDQSDDESDEGSEEIRQYFPGLTEAFDAVRALEGDDEEGKEG